MSATLQEWTDKLTSEALPVLQSTLDNLKQLLADDSASYNQLSSVILTDPNMVANTIKAANEQATERMHGTIHTVEHALMRLGMDGTQALQANLPVLEQMLQDRSPEIQNQVMGLYERSHHAAYQSMDWLKRLGDIEPGEVYIAGFLVNLAEVLMWLYEPETAAKVKAHRVQSEQGFDQAEEEILGVSYAQLTQSLILKLQLSPLLAQLLSKENIDNPRCLGVLLGQRLSYLAEKGWYHEEIIHCLGDVAEFLRQPLDVTIAITHSNSAHAARHHQYGIPAAAGYLPMSSSGLPAKLLDDEAQRVASFDLPTLISMEQIERIIELREQAGSSYEMAVHAQPDTLLYEHDVVIKEPLKEGYDTELIIKEDVDGDDNYIYSFEVHDHKLEEKGICQVPDEKTLDEVLQKLTREIDQSISMPDIMNLVMKGMHDGLGLTRVAFSMLIPNQTELKARAVLSLDQDWAFQHLHIPLKPTNLFTQVIARPQALWFQADNHDKIWPHIPEELKTVLHED
ncbi:MAG: HDOD domain-containing protein, partial [Gammaproteobacteria bacterium]|nr:HDOD domain-containing protein [Gammaproteobacteria bacterium]